MSFLKSRAIISVLFILSGAVLTANAQLHSGSSLRANIPVAFIINSKSFAAGNYTISRLDQGGVPDPNLLVLRGEDGSSAFINTNPYSSLDAAKQTTLAFDVIGGHYYLSRITYKGEENGNEINIGPRERQMLAEQTSPKRTLVLRETGE